MLFENYPQYSIALHNQKKVWPMVKSANAVIAISRAVKEKFEKEFNREIIVPYVEQLMLDNPGSVLENALLLKDGIVVDEEINRFQER